VPCVVADLEVAEALIDTAAEWCVLASGIVRALGYPVAASGPRAHLSTRLGSFAGTLERIPVRFPAAEGEDLAIEATWFVSEDWPGPVVLGWSGCLERLRFGLDPVEEVFYFRAP
jgi:hypothetical protein